MCTCHGVGEELGPVEGSDMWTGVDQEDHGQGSRLCVVMDPCLGPKVLRHKWKRGGSCSLRPWEPLHPLTRTWITRTRLTAGGPFVKYGVTIDNKGRLRPTMLGLYLILPLILITL